MDTWESVHVGDVVLGHDGLTYGVAGIKHGNPAGPIITLFRYGQTIGPSQPPPGTPITVLQRADVTAEARAFAALAECGIAAELIGERYEP